VEGKDPPLSFDTGASETYLFVRYYQRFRSESRAWKKSKAEIAGAGGVMKRKIYIQPRIKLGVGDKTVTLERVLIYTSGVGTSTHDVLYGNLGQDAAAKFESFTLNFSAMTFSLGRLLAPERRTSKFRSVKPAYGS